jgi:hypothetical protein
MFVGVRTSPEAEAAPSSSFLARTYLDPWVLEPAAAALSDDPGVGRLLLGSHNAAGLAETCTRAVESPTVAAGGSPWPESEQRVEAGCAAGAALAGWDANSAEGLFD